MFELVVFLHVLLGIGASGPMIHAATTANRCVRRADAASARTNARMLRLYGRVSVLVVVVGCALVSMKEDGEPVAKFSETWIWLSLLLWVAAVGLCEAVVAPTLDITAERVDAGESPASLKVKALVSGNLVALLVSAIVALMIYKPGH